MESSTVAAALAALSHDARLAAWRTLAAHGRGGLEAGRLADALATPANTLSAQLAILARAGLVTRSRRGRCVVYRARPESLAQLARELARLTREAEIHLHHLWSRENTVMNDQRPLNVLFLCTGNTARSILAESILRELGAGRFVAYSAGSRPQGVVNPWALKILEEEGFPTDGMRSKSWEEFARADAPDMDFVFTVCDSAAGEECPVWPGQPITAHWGVDDPAAAEGNDIDRRRAFQQAFRHLRNRIAIFTALPIQKLTKVALQREVDDIGALSGASAGAAAKRTCD